jgi:hypothetical protein
MVESVTRQEVYNRLLALECKVESIDKNTKDIVSAFNAARGAFVFLEFLAKVAKPLLFIGAMAVAIAAAMKGWKP